MTRFRLVTMLSAAVVIGTAAGAVCANAGAGCPQSVNPAMPFCSYSNNPLAQTVFTECVPAQICGANICQYEQCAGICGDGFSYSCVSPDYVCGYLPGCENFSCA
jgi:hypothetical protein